MGQKISQQSHTKTAQLLETDNRSKLYHNASRRTDNTHSDVSRLAGAAGLAVILGQLIAYFSGRANIDDMDILGFGLHHLFCQIDMLYRIILPDILHETPPEEKPKHHIEEYIQDQHLWTQLRAIKHTLERLEPLCNLLSDATEGILDALDSTHRRHNARKKTDAGPLLHDAKQSWLETLNQERWDMALTAITESLGQWQESHSHLTSLTQLTQPTNTLASNPTILQFDAALTIVLDSAGAIFGDIMPGFQAIAVEDDEAVATLLFDLMQQADQLLVQFDVMMEPLQTLIEYFALGTQTN